MRTSTLLAVLTLSTTLAVADPTCPWCDPTCPTMQDEQYYNRTTQEVTAISYVKPFTTPTKLFQVGYLAIENATLTAKLLPSHAESVMYFGERLPVHVGGKAKLTGNPVFGEWVDQYIGWISNYTNCTWNSVEKYLREGGSGLRLRRENLSTLTVKGWTLGNKTHAGSYEEYLAEPSDNTDEILVVFTDSVDLEISLAQANVVQLSISSFGPLPETPGYRPAMCTVTRRGARGAGAMDSFDVGPSLIRQSTEMSFHFPSHSPNGCCGMQILHTTEPMHPKIPTPTPTPSESSAVQSMARLAIVSSLFIAVVPSILLL